MEQLLFDIMRSFNVTLFVISRAMQCNRGTKDKSFYCPQKLSTVTVWVRRSHRTRLQTCLFKAWRPNPLGQLSAEHINYYTQSIACFFLNCYKTVTTNISAPTVLMIIWPTSPQPHFLPELTFTCT